MNLRHLHVLITDCEFSAIIERFLNKNRVKSNKTIYDDSQNIHDSNIVESIKESIYNILNDSKSISDDDILNNSTKEQLVEYCQYKTVHSLLNVTFEEVLCSGRISRLVNCLNGFDERISIKISDKEQILNVIIKIRNKYDSVEKQKEEIEKELIEKGFDKDVINEYIVYLE